MLRNKIFNGILNRLAVLLVAAALPVWGGDRTGSVSWVVKISSGAAAVGAVVRVKNADLGLTVSAISQADGRYAVPDLPAGKYTIRATGGGFQSDPVETVDVSAGQPATRTLTLSLR